jgi:signal transduction histidine kinase
MCLPWVRQHGFAALVVVLLVVAEITVAAGSTEGPAAVRYLFPLLWTVPLLFYRRAPAVIVLVVLGAITVEAYLAQPSTEADIVLLPVVLAFWIAGRIDNEMRSIVIGLVGSGLAVLTVAQNPGPVTGSDVVFLAIAAGAPYAVGVSMRAHDRSERELRRRAEELERTREAETRAALAEERTHIARELHDVVGHSVTLMTVQAGAARMIIESNPRAARERLLAVEHAGREALAEMRRLLGVLRAPGGSDSLGPQPGVDDLEQLVSGARSVGLDIQLAVEGEPLTLPAGEALAAYRIVQEALTNVSKHAADPRVAVRVRYVPGAVELTIENDGDRSVGPDWETSGGHGVIGMRERVDLYGGHLDVGPRPQGGFVVRARLPIEPHTR